MDPNQFNMNAYWQHFQNSHPPSNQNSPNRPPFPHFENNPNFQFLNFPYPPSNQSSQTHPFFPYMENNQNSQFYFLYPYQNPNPTMYYGASMGTSSAQSTNKTFETPRGSVSESEVAPFSTQDGLENITLDDGEEGATEKEKRSLFSREEDTLLISSWLGVSKDSIIGTDQTGRTFWGKVTMNYNMYRGELREKSERQLKSRWQKVNAAVQKFVGCYKSAVDLKKSGTTEKDTIEAAKKIYKKDNDHSFALEHAWQLLKNEPKWNKSVDASSKRTKTSATGAYSSGTNPETPTSEYNPPSPTLICPQGRKAAKRKGKEKLGETSFETQKRAEALEKIASIREREVQVKDDYNKRLEEYKKIKEAEVKIKELEMEELKKVKE